MLAEELALFWKRLCRYNHVRKPSTLLRSECLLLLGGILVERTDGQQFIPQCCCGLEGWREWMVSYETHKSPWLGHDPFPGLSWVGDQVSLLEDRESTEAPFCQMQAGELLLHLQKVHRDFNEFLDCFAGWAQTQPCFPVEELVAKLDTEFDIRRPL